MPDAALAMDAVVGRLLETLFFTAVLERGGPLPAPPCYTAALSFSGSRQGTLMVSASRRTAAVLAANLIGGDSLEVTPAQAASAVGEMANILCGSLLGALDQSGSFAIAPPDVSDCPEAAAALETLPLRRVYMLDEGPLATAVSFIGEPV